MERSQQKRKKKAHNISQNSKNICDIDPCNKTNLKMWGFFILIYAALWLLVQHFIQSWNLSFNWCLKLSLFVEASPHNKSDAVRHIYWDNIINIIFNMDIEKYVKNDRSHKFHVRAQCQVFSRELIPVNMKESIQTWLFFRFFRKLFFRQYLQWIST